MAHSAVINIGPTFVQAHPLHYRTSRHLYTKFHEDIDALSVSILSRGAASRLHSHLPTSFPRPCTTTCVIEPQYKLITVLPLLPALCINPAIPSLYRFVCYLVVMFQLSPV